MQIHQNRPPKKIKLHDSLLILCAHVLAMFHVLQCMAW